MLVRCSFSRSPSKHGLTPSGFMSRKIYLTGNSKTWPTETNPSQRVAVVLHADHRAFDPWLFFVCFAFLKARQGWSAINICSFSSIKRVVANTPTWCFVCRVGPRLMPLIHHLPVIILCVVCGFSAAQSKRITSPCLSYWPAAPVPSWRVHCVSFSFFLLLALLFRISHCCSLKAKHNTNRMSQEAISCINRVWIF